MKIVKTVLSIMFSMGLMLASAQTDKETTAKVIAAQSFIFNATDAYPMESNALNKVLNQLPNSRSSLMNLSGGQYEVRVTKDSIVAHLPYFGRTYTPSLDPNEAGTKFKSKDFKYSAVKKKKDWVITIEPEDIKERQKLIFRISESGYANLSINNYNRQPISFYGYISEIEANKGD